MSRPARLRSWCVRYWEHTQVELHGQYSIANLQDFEQYQARAGWLRVTVVCLLTPVPIIIYVLLIDMIPLEPPANGAVRSPCVWIRTWLVAFLSAGCLLEQLYKHIPVLKLSCWAIAVIGVLAATAAVTMVFVASLFLGYPLPFTMVVGTVPWAIITFGISVYLRREQFHEHTWLKRALKRYVTMMVGQVSLVFVYPIYSVFYKSLTSWNQTACVLLLPVIKVIAKNWICYTLPDSDDVKPEAVVFNVEIFHALFVSLCMGNTSSGHAVIALMAADLIQAWLSFFDMMSIVQDLGPIFAKIAKSDGSSLHRHANNVGTMLDNSLRLAGPPAQSRQSQAQHSPWRWRIQKSINRRLSMLAKKRVVPVEIVSFASVAPLPGPSDPAQNHEKPSDLTSLTVEEREQLQLQTQKLLFASEFIVLIEYVEVIMPVIYCIFLGGFFALPNRDFYPFLQGIGSSSDLAHMVSNIALYASCEFLSIIVMAVVVWRRFKFSLAHQLAFALERRAANIQAKLLMWVMWVMHNSIVHMGADYSLQFSWLSTQVLTPNSSA